MDVSTFWLIIDEARGDANDKAVKDRLVELLLPFEVDELAAFQTHFVR